VLLDAQHVTKTFGGLVAVNDVSLTVEPGSIVSVIGPNGAGKTTFFNVLTGIYKPTSGRILFDGAEITGLRPDQITQRGIARTFQNIRLFNNMTVLENVLVGMHGRLHAGLWGSLFLTPAVRAEEQSARKRAFELLAFVGLERKPGAMATQPKLILLDEPTAGMNPQETGEAIHLIRRLRDELGITVILIEHDMRVVMTISERVTVLDYGAKIAEGKPEEIRNNPQVIEAYLGRGAVVA
jgi:branched-chain amino acid transport system ATP-binding protein